MLRPWIWTTATLAPILIFISLLFACQYVVATVLQLGYTNADASIHSTDLYAGQVTVQSSTLATPTFDAILTQSVYPSGVVYPSGQVVYTLRISHTNVSAVSNLILTSTVSSEFVPVNSFAVGATITELTTYPVYTWRIDDLKSGGQAIVYIVGNLDSMQNVSGTLTNFSTLAVANDSNSSNDSFLHSLPITVPQVALDSYSIDVNESDTNAAIDVTLNISNPYGPVMIDYVAIDGSGTTNAISNLDYVPISGTLTISAARTSQRFFVELIDDSIDESLEKIDVLLSNPRGVNIGATSTISITIIDNDGAGTLVNPLQLELLEGGPTQTFSVTLTSQPLAPVNITLAENEETILSSNVLTFTSSNWHKPQIVSVASVNNHIADSNRNVLIINQTNSQDPVYHNRSISDVVINVVDDDEAKIILSPPTTISLTESAGADSNHSEAYTLALESEPVAPVNITIQPDAQLQTDMDSIIFTAQNWNKPQIVTVEVVDDSVAEEEHFGMISHTVNSEDANYDSAELENISIQIEDNDSAEVLLSIENFALLEGGDAGIYSVTLTSRPLYTVSISASTNDDQLTISPSNLLFSAENWNIPQAIELSANDDSTVEEINSIKVKHKSVSDDPMYDAITKEISVNIEDDDTAGIFVETAILTIREGVISSSQPVLTGTNTYDIVLISKPIETVTVTLITPEQLTATPEELIFTPEGWNQPQTVFMSVLDDQMLLGNQFYTITHQLTSGDPNYNIVTKELTASIVDNDQASVKMGDTSNMILQEGINSDDYTLSLSTKPSSVVTITLSTNDQLLAMPDVIIFSPQNWNQPQKVSLTPIDDDNVEESQTGTVTYTVSSSDEFYNNFEVETSDIVIIDNDQSSSIYIPIVQK